MNDLRLVHFTIINNYQFMNELSELNGVLPNCRWNKQG